MELIRYTCQPKIQIELTKYINYGPTMPEAYDSLDSRARAVLPTSPENRPKQFIYNARWWAENEPAVVERWNKWLLQR
jgi:putative spermidine/putrescine transport system substrate-binding protein